MVTKSSQLQLRVSPAQKSQIRRRAQRAGMTISEWVLVQVLPEAQREFEQLVAELGPGPTPSSHTLAALHDYLMRLAARQFDEGALSLSSAPPSGLSGAYLAAMVEQTAHRLGRPAPVWALEIGPVAEPYFASPLVSLRVHLLRFSPAPFKRRNLFVDSSVGDRV